MSKVGRGDQRSSPIGRCDLLGVPTKLDGGLHSPKIIGNRRDRDAVVGLRLQSARIGTGSHQDAHHVDVASEASDVKGRATVSVAGVDVTTLPGEPPYLREVTCVSGLWSP